MVTPAILALFINVIRIWNVSWRRMKLKNDGGFALEYITRGCGGLDNQAGRHGLREGSASTFSLVNEGHGFSILVDWDDDGIFLDPSPEGSRTISYYLANSNICYDPDTSSSGNEIYLFNNNCVRDFTVSKPQQDLVYLNLFLRKEYVGKNIDVNLSTAVCLRNL